MAYGIVHFYPGGTREHYDASMAAVHPGQGQLPDGQLFHAAGATPGGFPTPPQETAFEAHAFVSQQQP
jgi:hypothetical protein